MSDDSSRKERGPACLSLDIEVSRKTDRVYALGAVRGSDGEAYSWDAKHGESLNAALADLATFAGDSRFLLGHNIIAFDLPHLAAVAPDLSLLGLPVVDTLRLNPLAFPRNPYHHLVKHYQEGQLKRGRLNDPELDARETLQLFSDQRARLGESGPDLLLAWHWLTTVGDERSGLNNFFTMIRRQSRPEDAAFEAALSLLLADRGCVAAARRLMLDAAREGWALAYLLAWLSVSGGNSVLPPWVRHSFPRTEALITSLRDTPCGDVACAWCANHHNPDAQLKRWFGFDAYRPEPKDPKGGSLQRAIVVSAMRGAPTLGILPTGTGKSLCYQIPALSRYEKTGDLTLVISPLVALMEDQVKGLRERGIESCRALNGLLSMPERGEVLDGIRLGDVGILLIAPEQLRSKSFRKALAQRRIGCWVLDEAHCLSKWGQDFRPDYRYVGRFIREGAGEAPMPPILCLTATAKPEVVADLKGYFFKELGLEMVTLDGGSSRENLEFLVVPTSGGEKKGHLLQLLDQHLPEDAAGGAIVYCSTKKHTEEIAEFLAEHGRAVRHFHAGLPPETKKVTQQSFIRGDLQIIVATNAFGMGIDKPDVRLVIHADIPGSLENYLQEAGRAGRDRDAALCVLMYSEDDVERQFGLSARSRLTQHEIQTVLRSLRRLERRKHKGEIVATSGEILLEDERGEFNRDERTDDTRVRTAISWLENAELLKREHNEVTVFPSSLRVQDHAHAERLLGKFAPRADYQRQLLLLVDALLDADADEGISTDELMGLTGLNADGVRKALYDLAEVGVASNDTALTAFVHRGVSNGSEQRLREAGELEPALIDSLREQAPDLGVGDSSVLHMRPLAQSLRDQGHAHANPDRLRPLLKSLERDGRSDHQGRSLDLKPLDTESMRLTLRRDWGALAETARLRRVAAGLLLRHLLATVGEQRGVDLLATTTLGELVRTLSTDTELAARISDPGRLNDLALLWLHEQDIIRLNKGMAVFRTAMTIELAEGGGRFTKANFKPLQLHYDELVTQIHVMGEYAKLGLEKIADALRLSFDYFTLDRDAFLARWLQGRVKDLKRQVTHASWEAIVGSLKNKAQRDLVADERTSTNVLVLAGPGSGKTRVLVHRIAFLLRVRRESARGILALAYNRHAAVQIRQRLRELVGDDARGVMVMTCDALAMRLVGVSFAERARRAEDDDFRAVRRAATDLLRGEGLPELEADAQRERLLGGFRWILVDEYQDIGAEQYDLISALAGRTLEDQDARLNLFAVGDDDQNIYAFNGASVDYIRRFEQDYQAKPSYLLENYRSSGHIIRVANQLIAGSTVRMKSGNSITINRARAKDPPGGRWQALDPVARGRVQVLAEADGRTRQAVAVMRELTRLAALDPDWDWCRVAVIARNWNDLAPVRAWCEVQGLAAQPANERIAGFWRLRQTQQLLDRLRESEARLMELAATRTWIAGQAQDPWWSLLGQALREYELEVGSVPLPVASFTEWLAEWGREFSRRQTGLLLTSAHRAKGLEFDHVAILDGDWMRVDRDEDQDAPRRLYYVAMTRARETLVLAQIRGGNTPARVLADDAALLRRDPPDSSDLDPRLGRLYSDASPAEIDLGFVGRQAATDPIHARIAALRVGDQLELFGQGGGWVLRYQGQVVGRMSKKFNAARGRCLSATVGAILQRRREDEGEAFRGRIRCDRWELVLPEFVFGEQ